MPARQSGTWPTHRVPEACASGCTGCREYRCARCAISATTARIVAAARVRRWRAQACQPPRQGASGPCRRSRTASAARARRPGRRGRFRRGRSIRATPGGHDARTASSAARSLVDPMSTTFAPRVRASSAPTSAKRAGSHSLMLPSGSRLDADGDAPRRQLADQFRRSPPRLIRDLQPGDRAEALCHR